MDEWLTAINDQLSNFVENKEEEKTSPSKRKKRRSLKEVLTLKFTNQ
jgi:hypothetical protein